MKSERRLSSLLRSVAASFALTAFVAYAAPGSSVRPITNPTLFDNPTPQTNIHAIAIHQTLPSVIETTIGNEPVGGDFNLLALQFEIAFNESLSLVATKDGYIDFNPNATFSKSEGFANLAAGLKYLFISSDENDLAVSGTLTAELPSGNRDVWQGEGDGYINAILNASKSAGNVGLISSLGYRQPMGSEDPSIAFLSAHANYDLQNGFYPIVEFNWFHVSRAGNGSPRFPDQVGGLVPAIGVFEGGDLISLGSQYATYNRDIMTGALGFRYSIDDKQNIGIAYESVFTGDEDNLMDDRITIDYILKF